MVRKFLVLCFFFTLFSCISYRTEFGKKRFKMDLSKIKQIQNDSVFKVIDTTKLYETISSFSFGNNNYVSDLKKRYLKFYSNGKIGVFYYFDINDISSLNPKKADIGYYKYHNNKIIMQTFFEHPQGGGYAKSECVINKNKNEYLELKSDDYLKKYKIIDLPKEFLIYRPDW
jgi:hypothetical protein